LRKNDVITPEHMLSPLQDHLYWR